MMTFVALISLSVLTAVYGQDPVATFMQQFYQNTPRYDYTFPPINVDDWLYDLVGISHGCDPNPCLNGGSCDTRPYSGFITCICPEPYTGKNCQRVKNLCQDTNCGRGDCVVNLKKAPYYECKCTFPYLGQDCNLLPSSPCDLNPCQNGASCIRGEHSRCACLDGYNGIFCEIGPNDCYEGNGETYTGVVSETDAGEECLDWNSYFILVNGGDPFTTYEGNSVLGFHNQCRNPDGDDRPWCFVKRSSRLEWDYCKVKKCSEAPTAAPPTTAETHIDTTTQFSQCGKPESIHSGRIFGGGKSLPGAHPWQVSFQTRPSGSSNQFVHSCGGILIRSCWVLTATHCIPSPSEDMQVVLGGVNIHKDEANDQTIPVEQAFVHEGYKDIDGVLYNDIALLRLKVMDSPYCAKETRFVKTACLPDQPIPTGAECVVSGWGRTENSDHRSSHLLNARILLISQELCKTPAVYGPVLDDSMFCAGIMLGGTDSCRGDSGGPLVCEQHGSHYVTGVVSWGRGCGLQNKPGVYVNVRNFINWINSKIY